jgi:hypothetical protein
MQIQITVTVGSGTLLCTTVCILIIIGEMADRFRGKANCAMSSPVRGIAAMRRKTVKR